MPSKAKNQHLVRVNRKLELSFRTARSVSDVIDHIRSVNRDNPLMWGCYRKRKRYSVREFAFTELVTPGRDFISVCMDCTTHKKRGSSKIGILVNCNVKEREGGGNGNFRREFEIGKKDPDWEKAVSCFGECLKNGHDLMSIFGQE